MNKTNILRCLAIVIAAFSMMAAHAQSSFEKQVLMTIGDQKVTVKQFMDVYSKNNLRSDVIEKKSVDEYLDLYINFRMKVMEAYAMRLDTCAKFKKELEGYRKQLAKPYFTNDEVSEELVEEAYQRKLKDIRASHILITCDKHALPADTLKAYNKAMEIRRKALSGEDFGDLAVAYSQDPSARDVKATETTPARRGNRGDLGYFTVFDMVYPFETGAYNTPEGGVSMPVRSDFGYHIIKVFNVTEALGTIQAAHIFIQVAQDAAEEVVEEARSKAENIYAELMAQDGKNWGEAVNKYSDDRGTVPRNGALSPFTVNRIVPEFVETIKQLQPNEISRPVRTSYGFHIIKLINVSKVGTFEQERQAIAERVEKDMRSKKSEEVVIQQIKKDYGFKLNDKNLNNFMASVDSTIINPPFVPASNAKMQSVLFSIGNMRYTVQDLVDYFLAHQSVQRYLSAQTYAYQLYDAFEKEKIFEYADQHLEEKYPEFKALVQEYNDGILLFDLMERQVWNRAVEDTVGLQAFYERNTDKYMWNERAEAYVITCGRKESLDKVKQYLADGVPYDSLRVMFVRDTVNYAYVRNGFYQRGDNQYVDATEWVPGTVNEIASTVDQTTVIVAIMQVRDPEPKTLREAKGLVTSDYQVELEEQWLEALHEKYPVKINEKVLQKVREQYQ